MRHHRTRGQLIPMAQRDAGINSSMKTISIPLGLSRKERDALIHEIVQAIKRGITIKSACKN